MWAWIREPEKIRGMEPGKNNCSYRRPSYRSCDLRVRGSDGKKQRNEYLAFSHIVIYSEKYVFGLRPPFWHRDPKTLIYSEVSIVL